MLKVTEKYIIAFEESLKKDILSLMKKDWYFEILDSKKIQSMNDTELQEIDYKLSSVDFAISFLSLFGKKESFISGLKNPKIIVNKNKLDNFKEEELLNNLIDEVVRTERKIKILDKEEKEARERIKELEQFGCLDFVPQETENTHSFIIKINSKKEREYLEYFRINEVFNKEISKYQSKTTFAIICLKDKKEEILNFLKENSGEVVSYAFERPVEEEKRLLLKIIEEGNQERFNVNKELALKSNYIKDLKIYHDILCLKKREIEMKVKTLSSDFLSYLMFWAVKEEKDRFEKEVKKISKEVRIIKVTVDEGELSPVFLENTKAISPFQAVTDIFGLPSSSEVDPTPYLSLFFIVYFGICITDAGYGLLLILFTGSLLILFKEKFSTSKLIKLLFYAGISTFIMGVLFGSYFGVSATELHIPFMQRFKVIDPIKDTLLFMGIAFLLGYIQICFAQIVKIIQSKKQKNKEGVISGFVWFSFYISAGIYLLSLALDFLRIYSIMGLIVFGLGLFLVEGRGQKIFLIPLIGGIKILQGLIGTVSDVLSYSRLMALGLGTGVIALIVNQIAFLLGGMVPYVGWLFTGLILICGHIFNLGINALGGFIHSARLQFVEFFPKFMEGGGRRLEPIEEELKYIKIN